MTTYKKPTMLRLSAPAVNAVTWCFLVKQYLQAKNNGKWDKSWIPDKKLKRYRYASKAPQSFMVWVRTGESVVCRINAS